MTEAPKSKVEISFLRISTLLRASLVVAFVFLVVIVLLPRCILRPRSSLFRNEASAVARVRTIINLQNEYSAAHPYNGFACQLPLLKPAEQSRNTYGSLDFLDRRTQMGYRFWLGNCGPDANRANVHYQVAAVPIEPGKTGTRVFCADQTGFIWYDESGAATSCLASRRELR